MKIKTIVLDSDERYLQRLMTYLAQKYADKLELEVFSDPEIAVRAIQEKKTDVFLVGSDFSVDANTLPQGTVMAYLTDTADIEKFRNEKTVCRYVDMETFFKQIENLWAENAGDICLCVPNTGNCDLSVYLSVAGGSGASTTAAAYALSLTAQKEKTLFISFDAVSMSDLMFPPNGLGTMSDLVYAIKSRKTNFSAKLSTCAAEDVTGLWYIASPKSPLDVAELQPEEIASMMMKMKSENDYRHIVVDMPLTFDDRTRAVCRLAESVVLVTETTATALHKLAAVTSCWKNFDDALCSKTLLLYNKVREQIADKMSGTEMKLLGFVPFIEQQNVRSVATQLSGVFDMISASNRERR